MSTDINVGWSGARVAGLVVWYSRVEGLELMALKDLVDLNAIGSLRLVCLLICLGERCFVIKCRRLVFRTIVDSQNNGWCRYKSEERRGGGGWGLLVERAEGGY
jgi:hypothetical protein